jgi:hypothetical protein
LPKVFQGPTYSQREHISLPFALGVPNPTHVEHLQTEHSVHMWHLHKCALYFQCTRCAPVGGSRRTVYHRNIQISRFQAYAGAPTLPSQYAEHPLLGLATNAPKVVAHKIQIGDQSPVSMSQYLIVKQVTAQHLEDTRRPRPLRIPSSAAIGPRAGHQYPTMI